MIPRVRAWSRFRAADTDRPKRHIARGMPPRDHHANREEALDFRRCQERLTGENAKLPEVGVPICRICIKVGHLGRRRSAGSAAPG